MIDHKDPEVQHLLKTIQIVWSQIGSDILSACEEYDHYVDNEEAIECCIDADRLLIHGNQEAQDTFNSLTQTHGRSQVWEFLNKELYLN